MRVSLPICISSAALVVLLSWWLCTRSRDFLTPPSGAELAKVRMAASQTNPTAQGLGDALSPSTSKDKESTPIPVILPESLTIAPGIEDYRDEARYGAQYLIELAGLLEAADQPERALSCWERVIDSCKTKANQSDKAIQSIKRINAELRESGLVPPAPIRLPIVIRSGTGPSAAQALEPVLESAAKQLEQYSLGILDVSSKVSAGTEDMIEEGKSPAAIWISGPDENNASTDVVSLLISHEKPEDLKSQVEGELYRIIRHHLGQMDDFQPLPKAKDRYSPDKLLEERITRMVWKQLAESLQKTP
jgi:hypothetical protein